MVRAFFKTCQPFRESCTRLPPSPTFLHLLIPARSALFPHPASTTPFKGVCIPGQAGPRARKNDYYNILLPIYYTCSSWTKPQLTCQPCPAGRSASVPMHPQGAQRWSLVEQKARMRPLSAAAQGLRQATAAAFATPARSCLWACAACSSYALQASGKQSWRSWRGLVPGELAQLAAARTCLTCRRPPTILLHPLMQGLHLRSQCSGSRGAAWSMQGGGLGRRARHSRGCVVAQ